MTLSRPLAVGALLATCAGLVVLVVATADAAKVRVGTLVLTADGGFQPRALPRRAYAPIRFQGHANIRTTHGGPPPALRRVRLDFDRDGRLTTAGLPVCGAARIEGTTPKVARRRCRGAIVGTGQVRATISLPGRAPVGVRSPLTLFNGPRQGGNPTVLAHARTVFPAPQTHVVVVPIERRRGSLRYRATFDVPEIADGFGALTHASVKVGKRYRFRGAKRSYVSARCADGILETHGLLSFADGTIISGTVFKPCNVRR